MAWFRLPLVVPDRLMRRAPSTIGDQQRWGVQEVFEHLRLHPLKTFVPVAAGKMHVDEVDFAARATSIFWNRQCALSARRR
jgi:hypothetical protein